MNTQDDFQILREERTKLVNEIADLQTENRQLREAKGDFCHHVSICRKCPELKQSFCPEARQIIKDIFQNPNWKKAV